MFHVEICIGLHTSSGTAEHTYIFIKFYNKGERTTFNEPVWVQQHELQIHPHQKQSPYSPKCQGYLACN